MTWLEKLFFLIKSQAFIKTMIVILSVVVNTMLSETPPKNMKELIFNIFKHSIFVLFALLVFSPALTPWLTLILSKYLTWASAIALNQLSFWLILVLSQQIILYAKHYINKKDKENDT